MPARVHKINPGKHTHTHIYTYTCQWRTRFNRARQERRSCEGSPLLAAWRAKGERKPPCCGGTCCCCGQRSEAAPAARLADMLLLSDGIDADTFRICASATGPGSKNRGGSAICTVSLCGDTCKDAGGCSGGQWPRLGGDSSGDSGKPGDSRVDRLPRRLLASACRSESCCSVMGASARELEGGASKIGADGSTAGHGPCARVACRSDEVPSGAAPHAMTVDTLGRGKCGNLVLPVSSSPSLASATTRVEPLQLSTALLEWLCTEPLRERCTAAAPQPPSKLAPHLRA